MINGIAGVGGGILTPRNKLWKEDLLISVSLPSQSSRPLHLSHVCVPCVSVYGGGRGVGDVGELGGGGRCVCVCVLGGGGGMGAGAVCEEYGNTMIIVHTGPQSER